MKKSGLLTLGLAMVLGFLAGCKCDCDKSEKQELDQETVPREELNEKVADLADDLTYFIEEIELDGGVKEGIRKDLIVSDQFGDGSKLGDVNIAIRYWPTTRDMWLWVVKKTDLINPKVDSLEINGERHVDLSKNTVALRMGRKNNIETLKVETFGANKMKPSLSWSEPDKWTITSKYFDAKVLPVYNPTGGPAFIGIEDARDFNDQNGKQDARTVTLEYHDLNRKRMRLWFDKANNQLLISTNDETKIVKINQDKKKVGSIFWGTDLYKKY